MKFNKAFQTYIAVWAILLVLFNVLAFVPKTVAESSGLTASFWIGYIFITIAFLGQLFCSYIALKEENLNKLFYNISIFKTSYTALIVNCIAGSLCMIFSFIPYWISVVVCMIILVFSVLSVIKATVAADTVSKIDSKIKTQTFFIKSLTVDADTLLASAKSDEVKAECKKVYDAVRFSDPMSNEALASIEGQITVNFAELTAAVEEDDTEAVKTLAKTVLILLKDRNNKCKLLK